MENIFNGDLNEAMNVRNLLENEGIEVFTINEQMASIEPVISPGGFLPVVLKINENDFERAKKIVDQYRNGNFSLDNQ